jgi:hypothetical protein
LGKLAKRRVVAAGVEIYATKEGESLSGLHLNHTEIERQADAKSSESARMQAIQDQPPGRTPSRRALTRAIASRKIGSGAKHDADQSKH